MATYVMSDIHGYLNRVSDLLRQVSFGDGDELFVLGDIIDRGPQSAEAITWAIEEAPRNIHFLMGNHEDMMLSVLKRDINAFTIEESQAWEWDEPWSWNGGGETMQALYDLTTPLWRYDVLIPWLKNLPFYFDVTLGEDRYMMVHAGLSTSVYRSDDFYSNGIRKQIDIPDYGEVFSQTLLWLRERWLYNTEELPYNVIFGHTPTSYWIENLKEEFHLGWYDGYIKGQGAPEMIATLTLRNGKKKICVDTGRNCLGMLRLDDMQEFYSEVNCGEFE